MANRYAKDKGGWTEAEIATLTRLRKANVTYSVILEALPGRTRSSCIAKATRLGMGKKRGPLKQPRRAKIAIRVPKPTPDPKPTTTVTLATSACLRVAFAAPQQAPLPPVDAGLLRCTLVELTTTSCRWPIGDPARPDFRFCGEPKDGPTYCEYHRAMAYGGQLKVPFTYKNLRKFV